MKTMSPDPTLIMGQVGFPFALAGKASSLNRLCEDNFDISVI